MKLRMKSLLALIMAGTMLLPTLIACANKGGDDTTTTAATTTTPEEPTPDYAALLASNPYAAAAVTLMEESIDNYYNKRSHTIQFTLTNTGTNYVWPATAFVEALAETYALFPDNKKVKDCYIDMLDHGYDKYKVSNVSLTTPAGRFNNITYYNSSAGNRGDFYYDDNAWICLRYLTAYEQFGKEDYLNRAKEILEFLWTGYDDYQGGGIYWSKTFDKDDKGNPGKSNKGVCTNGPAAISHLWMYQITGEDIYFERGKLLYDWVNDTLRDPRGIYFAGVNDPWQPAYDQGTMLYATCLMYEITEDDAYLKMARTSSRAIATHMFTAKGTGENMVVTMKRNPIYKAWCVGWSTRGMVKFVETKPGKSTYMTMLKNVMDQTLKTKDKNGQYDPFFCSPGTDFWDKKYFDDDAMQPAGVVIVLQLIAYYDAYQMNISYDT